ncbi:MAG: hypothetical protein IJ491_05170 [Clostridia bacterium]|nr:hypothetical protein [Clostridia bacterium]
MNKLTVESINKKLIDNPKSFIEECETAYGEKISSIARDVSGKPGRELVMLAGPSSSGKTTTAKMLKYAIEGFGRKAKVVSLDDFYCDQNLIYTFEDGTTDYETVKALDTKLISECLSSLMENGSAQMPHFSFQTKKREGFEEMLCDSDEIIIVEGLHALNPVITDPLEKESMKKLYVSVSSRIYDEDKVLFSKRDLRFIRRLIRDYHFRSSEVDFTFYLWKGVRMGEDRYLFPFSGRADERIDSIHPYEPSLFKKEAEKLLDLVGEESVYYCTAVSLKEKLNLFHGIDEKQIPADSLLREFIG